MKKLARFAALATVVLFGLAWAGGASAADTVLGFDDVPAGTPLDQYPTSGPAAVDFTVAEPNAKTPGLVPVVQSAPQGQAQSGGQVLSIASCPSGSSCGEFFEPRVTGSFPTNHQQISVYVGYFANANTAGDHARVVFTAYDINGTPVGSSEAVVTAGDGFHTKLSVAASSPSIKFFEVAAPDGADVSKAIAIDDLTLDNPTAPVKPDFNVSATSANLDIGQGGSGTDSLKITRSNFAGPLTFKATGLPAGVQPDFSPNPSSGNQTLLKLTVGPGVQPTGPSGAPFTVTATPAGATPAPRTVPLHLFVHGDFSLSLGASVVDLANCSVDVPVTVTRSLSFPGPVILSVSGVPATVTASLAPTSLVFKSGGTQDTSTLTVAGTANGQSVPPTTVTVHATSGSAPEQTASLVVQGACPVPYDLQVNAIQVTQGVQSIPLLGRNPAGATLPVDYQQQFAPNSFADEARLVQGAQTVVRVFANAALAGDAGIPGVSVQLRGYREDGGAELPGGPLDPIDGTKRVVQGPSVVPLAVESDPMGAFTFVLPAAWTHVPLLRLVAVVQAPQIPGFRECETPACQANNSFTLSRIPFYETQPLFIQPVAMTVDGVPAPPAPGNVFSAAVNVTPLHVEVSPYAATLNVTDLSQLRPNKGENSVAFDTRLGTAVLNRLDEYDCDNTVGSAVYHIGVTTLGRSMEHEHYVWTCQALEFIYTKADAVVEADRPYTSVAHEWFHILGRPHASQCTPDPLQPSFGEAWPDNQGYIESIGLDRSTILRPARPFAIKYPGVGQPQWYDFMSYCANNKGDPDSWVSLHNWNAIVSKWGSGPGLDSVSNAAGSPNMGATESSSSPYYYGGGTAPAGYGSSWVQATSGVKLRGPALRVSAFQTSEGVQIGTVAPAPAGLRSRPGNSEYRLAVLDRSGKQVSSVPMSEQAFHVDGAGSAIGLDAVVPATSAMGIAIVDPTGKSVAKRMRSAPPLVKILSPTRKTRLGKQRLVRVLWRASDPDTRQLIATVAYSANGGRSWRAIYIGPNRNAISLPRSYFAGSRDARVRVEVSDGFNKVAAVSARFRVAGSPPTVRILSPARNAQIQAGTAVYLSGEAFDDALQPLSGRRLRWFVGNTALGRGQRISTTALPVGQDVIRLVATDRRGSKAIAMVTVSVAKAGA